MNKYTFLFSVFFLNYSFGQLITNTSQSPLTLVQNVLLGQGISVSNCSFSGSSSSIGTFTAYGTNLGIEGGIAMTTGTVLNNGNGPQGPNDQSNSGIDNNNSGYVLLSNLISGSTTTNASVLQFDFVPIFDSVKFRFVFGSEEYPEYVGSAFNDIFAFFISGPGINGLQNIAKLPNSSPVTINNINQNTNSFYFVNNGDGTQAPYNTFSNFIQYDGYTSVLDAISPVQSGQTYHLILAIADVGDGILDSGIFLEAYSFTSTDNIGDAGVNEISNSDYSINVNPNPTVEESILKIVLPKTSEVSYLIMNALGQIIESENLGSLKDGVHSLKLNTVDYTTGVYFVKVKMGEKIITQKVIVK